MENGYSFLFHFIRETNISSDKLLHSTKKFLEIERRHSDETNKTLYIYRERSIDDGSRFDPRIDKYTSESLSRRKNRPIQVDRSKDDKRFNSLGRVSQHQGPQGMSPTIKDMSPMIKGV